jgi:hypothetical protein
MMRAAGLSEERLGLLLSSPPIIQELERERAKRHKAHQRWHEWLNPNTLTTMSDEQLKKQFIDYYETGAGRHSFNQINRDRIVREVNRFRNFLSFLLDESIDTKIRLDKTLDKKGEFYVEGVGKALVTSFLVDHDPVKYCVWNNKVEQGLEALGMLPPSSRGEKMSDRYLKILAQSNHIMNLSPEPYNNIIDLNHIFHIIAATPSGQEALNQILGGGDVLTDEAAPALVQFGMERVLEDFLAENFEKVFPELQLYQDEESDSGRQYQTEVGRIDFLARRKRDKSLVVIELKLGKSSDAVVGQILRYMQWVKENLSEISEDKVSGIVVAAEQDDKLRYALRMIPDVDFYSYVVDFKVKRLGK